MSGRCAGPARWSPTLRGGAWTARLLAVSLLIAGVAGLSFAGDIKISVDQIPKASGPLQRLKLSRSDVQTEFTRKVLANVAPGASLEALSQSKFAQEHKITGATNVQAAVDNDHVVALVDAAKGHVDVFPVLDKLTPAAASSDGKTIPAMPKAAADQASKVAASVLSQGVFGTDASRPVLDKPVTLNAATFNQPAGNAPATMDKGKSGPVLVSFPVIRMIGDLPVFGVGSHGLISVDGAGKINGFSKHWQTASANDQVTETRTPAQIVDLIKQQLADLASKGDVVVEDVKLGYYDGDEKFIQPVYQFRAKVSYTPQAGGKVLGADAFVIGHIPIGEALEPIPSLLDKAQSAPAVAPGGSSKLPVASLGPTEPSDVAGEAPEGDPTVGRYVVRNAESGWVASANGFWNGIQASGWGGWFTNSQYYWAVPSLFEGSKNSYVNSVNIALAEGHGDWYLFTTYQNWGDVVYIDSIPYPGYGAAAGGVCAYFIIHSCEVVPAAVDTAGWATKWWHVFGGLHSVLGYRTIMYIDDGVMYPFGKHVGYGSMLVSSWLNDVVSSPYYWFRPGGVMHGVWKPYGRPSTISVCGHENDSAYNTAALPRAGCLVNYWYN